MTRFEKDLSKKISINGRASSRGVYNLMVSRRDLSLWRNGMKPHRNWKVGDCKRYFGIKGNREKIYKDICEMVEKYVNTVPMGRLEFIQKYFYPELTPLERVEHQVGDLEWADSFLVDTANGMGISLDLKK